MILYRISQSINNGYDTFDSAIVCAINEEAARMTHPDSPEVWDGMSKDYDSWCSAADVKVEMIGIAFGSIEPGVICASYNAG